MPSTLRDFLLNKAHLKQKEILQIQNGQPVTKELNTERREEIALTGVVHIRVSPEYFLTRISNFLNFDTGKGHVQNGVFSTPPRLSDISGLRWEADDLEKIRDCNPRDCTSRLPGGDVSLFHHKVDWSSGNAMEQANQLMLRLSVEYIKNYQNYGDDALTSYLQDGKIWSVKQGTHRLLKNSPYLYDRAPELASYLQNYPKEKQREAKNIFYWQKFNFGLQPVIRFNHVVILPVKDSSHSSYMIGSKMLFANHYFRDGLELRSLIPDQRGKSSGFYLLVINRSHVDGMTGLKGLFIRGSAIKESVDKLKRFLTATKVQLERGYKGD